MVCPWGMPVDTRHRVVWVGALSRGRSRADNQLVDAIVLVLILGASMVLAVMGARTMLVGILHVMANPSAAARMLRGGVALGLAAAAVGLWYLAPVIASQLP